MAWLAWLSWLSWPTDYMPYTPYIYAIYHISIQKIRAGLCTPRGSRGPNSGSAGPRNGCAPSRNRSWSLPEWGPPSAHLPHSEAPRLPLSEVHVLCPASLFPRVLSCGVRSWSLSYRVPNVRILHGRIGCAYAQNPLLGSARMRFPTRILRTRIRRKQQNQRIRRIKRIQRMRRVGSIRRTPRIKQKRQSRGAVERVEVGSGLLSSMKLVRGYATAAS